jgi:hypothetical protein
LGALVVAVVAAASLGIHQFSASAWHDNSAGTSKMGAKMNEATGFYCNAKALGKAERQRYNELIAKLATARIETQELQDGYGFRLKSPEAVSLVEVAEWISYERRCCPFFHFEFELLEDGGPLWLKLRGSEGVKPFIRAEFGIR